MKIPRRAFREDPMLLGLSRGLWSAWGRVAGRLRRRIVGRGIGTRAMVLLCLFLWLLGLGGGDVCESRPCILVEAGIVSGSSHRRLREHTLGKLRTRYAKPTATAA
jgi:hypothetical protein